MHLLVRYHEEIQTPLDVFVKVFEEDWSQYAVTVFKMIEIEDARKDPAVLE